MGKHWSSEEDTILKKAVSEVGTCWKSVASRVQTRTPRQCRERYQWRNYDFIKKSSEWTTKDDMQLLDAYYEAYSKTRNVAPTNWKLVSNGLAKKRTPGAVKMRYYSDAFKSFYKEVVGKQLETIELFCKTL